MRFVCRGVHLYENTTLLQHYNFFTDEADQNMSKIKSIGTENEQSSILQ